MDPVCDLFHRCVAQRHDDDWYEFTRLYDPCLRQMLRLPLRRFNVRLRKQDADELLQELYVRLLLQGVHFRGRTRGELWFYLTRTAHNLVIDHWRTLRRRQDLASAGCLKRARCLADPEPSPERRAMARQRLVLFLDRCRWATGGFQVALKLRVMRLAFLDGRSSREIARELPEPLSPTQVDSMIFRLRRRLSRRGIDMPRRRYFRPAPGLPRPPLGARSPLSIGR